MTMPSEKPLGVIATSRSHENRRASKPLMEKRRRARINQSLSELKSLILDAVKKDSQNSRHSKLEKADILEMTVKHLQNLHRQRITVSSTHAPAINKFRAGFAECAKEVTHFVDRVEGANPELKSRLLNHLTKCLNTVAECEPQPPAAMPERPNSADTSASSSSSEYSHPCSSPLQASSPNHFSAGYPSHHHVTLVDPSSVEYPVSPLNLATNSREQSSSMEEDYFSDSEMPCLRPGSVELPRHEVANGMHQQPLPLEDPVWRPW